VFTLKTLREFLLREKGEKCVLFSPRKRKPLRQNHHPKNPLKDSALINL
jgi:hypothetical protein